MTNGLGGNVRVEFDIKDVSYSDMTMYRVDARIIKHSTKLLTEIHSFIEENYPDHDCLKYGSMYLLRNVEHMDMALKLRF